MKKSKKECDLIQIFHKVGEFCRRYFFSSNEFCRFSTRHTDTQRESKTDERMEREKKRKMDLD